MKKLLEILRGIPSNKWIKYRFELENAVTRIAGQEIAIYLQNMMECLEF